MASNVTRSRHANRNITKMKGKVKRFMILRTFTGERNTTSRNAGKPTSTMKNENLKTRSIHTNFVGEKKKKREIRQKGGSRKVNKRLQGAEERPGIYGPV